MKCPYCLSDVDPAASVCKVCTRDLYLFKPLLEKIAVLESRLDGLPERERLQSKIHELESQLDALKNEEGQSDTILDQFVKVMQYLVLPLLVLLAAHGLITVVYDLPLLFLHIVSILVPAPFAYYLFAHKKRSVLGWFAGSIVLASLAVIGMSGITSLVDGTPIMPRSPIEWKDFIEYSASISFSFLTGMLIGVMQYKKRHSVSKLKMNPWVAAAMLGLGDGRLSPETLQKMMHKVNEFGSTAVALATTAISVYTGLKGFLG